MDSNEINSPVENIDSLSVNIESNTEDSFDDSKSNDVGINANNSGNTYDFEFGQGISYGDHKPTNFDKEVEVSPLSDCQSHSESQNDHTLLAVTEDKNISKDKDCNNTEVKLKASKKFDVPNSFGSVCDVCAKTVYPMERLMFDKKCYHKTCLKCCKCGKTLNPTVVTKSNNNIFCKPHYKELFLKRGRYDDINVPSDNKSDQEPTKITDISATVCPVGAPESESNKGECDRTVLNKSVCDDSKEGRVNNPSEWKRNNSNNSNKDNESSEMSPVNPNASVKNLTTMFESNQ